MKHIPGFFLSKTVGLTRKAFAAAAFSGGIRIVEVKTFSIQTTRKLQRGIAEVQKAFQIGNHFYAIVLHIIEFIYCATSRHKKPADGNDGLLYSFIFN